MRRSERLVYITKYLLEHPGETISLKTFVTALGAAKSSISEDVALIKGAMDQMGLGRVETELGAAGGVQYLPGREGERALALAWELSTRLSDFQRVLPGLPLSDRCRLFSPGGSPGGEGLCRPFHPCRPDYVVTVETKGIPIALATAYSWGSPGGGPAGEPGYRGSAVSITYVSGSSRRLQIMSLAEPALRAGVIIDDFMKAGYPTGLQELLTEFKAEIVGTGVLMVTADPPEKLVQDYLALLVLEEVDEVGQEVRVRPSSWLRQEGGEEP